MVRNLSPTFNNQSVILTWDPPEECDILRYTIRYKRKAEDSEEYTYFSVPGDSLQQEFTCGGSDEASSLQPLTMYVFQVKPYIQTNFMPLFRGDPDWSPLVECYIRKLRLIIC